MYQKIIILGNLGSDVTMRYTQSGTPVASFSVATNRRWTGSDDEKKEQVTWYKVSVWNKLAETCNQYLTKGRTVLVEGTMEPDPDSGSPRIWTDNNGNPRASYELRAQVVQFLGGTRNDSTSESGDTSSEDMF